MTDVRWVPVGACVKAKVRSPGSLCVRSDIRRTVTPRHLLPLSSSRPAKTVLDTGTRSRVGKVVSGLGGWRQLASTAQTLTLSV